MFKPSPLSKKTELILGLLEAGKELYGLEMVSMSKQLKRGTIYVTLSRMEDQGLVKSREIKPDSGRGPARRVYKITGYGIRLLDAARAAKTSWKLAMQQSPVGGGKRE